jgi:excisionase family DNA binding protein
MPEQIYFTKDEAAQYLRCSIRSIDYLRERDGLRAYRFNNRKRLRFLRDDLDRFVQPRSAAHAPLASSELSDIDIL